MITKKFGIDFDSKGGALTLAPFEVVQLDDYKHNVEYSRAHKDGWTITGVIHEDFYEWVNDFNAHHPLYGKIKGNFEHKVYATSEEGFTHFWKHHAPQAWDYGDI